MHRNTNRIVTKCIVTPLFNTVLFAVTGLCEELYSEQHERDHERFKPILSAHAWCDSSGNRFVVYNMEKPSQMCEIHFVWSCPTGPSRWGMCISIDWVRLKSCQAVCDECTKGEICSGQSWFAGWFAMWTWWSWRESCITKIWGLGRDHKFVLFLFATMGFHIARSVIFWTPTFVL